MINLQNKIISKLKEIPELLNDEGAFLKYKTLQELTNSNKSKIHSLIFEKIYTDKELSKEFIDEENILGKKIIEFNKTKLIDILSLNLYDGKSFTKYGTAIKLTDNFTKDVDSVEEIVLRWPYRDSVINGGMKNEEVQNDEAFYNEILDRDNINALMAPKTFVKEKLITKNGEEDAVFFDSFEKNDGLMIKGNNFVSISSLLSRFQGKVDMIYIDPPYNTRSEQGYNDSFKRSSWLTFMKNRLEVAKSLLSPRGSIWIQIDDYEHAYLKVLCDEIFGKENFKSNITWQRTYKPKNNSLEISSSTDYILVYSSNKEWKPNKLNRVEKNNVNYKIDLNDGRGLFRTSPFRDSANGNSKNKYKITNPVNGFEFEAPSFGWRIVEKTYKELLANDDIYFGKDGKSFPTKKIYLSEAKGVIPTNLWTNEDTDSTNTAQEELKLLFETDKSPFKTPKPEKLLQRIIHIGSKEGDLILDFFGGSGTTASVAHKMGRKWIICEQMDYIESITKERMKKVIKGDKTKLSNDLSWNGGGSFYYAELNVIGQENDHDIYEIFDKDIKPKETTPFTKSFYNCNGDK